MREKRIENLFFWINSRAPLYQLHVVVGKVNSFLFGTLLLTNWLKIWLWVIKHYLNLFMVFRYIKAIRREIKFHKSLVFYKRGLCGGGRSARVVEIFLKIEPVLDSQNMFFTWSGVSLDNLQLLRELWKCPQGLQYWVKEWQYQ